MVTGLRQVVLASVCAMVAGSAMAASAQQGFFSKDDVIKYTPDWKGERFADGRPKVPDDILDRMKTVTLEEAQATIEGSCFNHEYEDGWGLVIHPDQVLVGRALTAMWMPGRPDIQKVIEQDQGTGRQGAMNAWPVDMLQPRDVYVADHFGLKQEGPSIGDNVGNAIYARSGNGIVYDGAVRDINGLEELKNFTSYVRYYDPSHHYGSLASGQKLNSTMVSINGPIRIGHATVMPGDVVLGRNGGVIFIPAQLAERVVEQSERTRLRDIFGHQRLEEKKYTGGQIDARWTPEIEADYRGWLKENENKLTVSAAEVEKILAEANQPRPAGPPAGGAPGGRLNACGN